MFGVAEFAAGIYYLTAIVRAITPEKPAEQVGSGVIGNWADRIPILGFRGAQHAWRCFLANRRKFDPRENHILLRAMITAHWRAVAQALAVYGRAQGHSLSTTADSLPLPQGLRDAALRLKNSGRPQSLELRAEFEALRAVLRVCDERAKAENIQAPEGWADVLDPLYDDLTVLVAQGGRPSLGPAEQAWQALHAEFPELNTREPLREFFLENWFTFFTVNFQFATQDDQVAPLLMGKLFAEIRERDGGPAIDSQRLLTALNAGVDGLHDHLQGMEERLTAEIRNIAQAPRAPVRERVIGLINIHQGIVGRDDEARALLEALEPDEPGLISITAPPGFGKSVLFARAVSLKMPGLDLNAAGLEGLAVLDAILKQPTLEELADLVGRITGLQETATHFKGAAGEAARGAFFEFLNTAGRVWIVIENAERALLPEMDSEFRALLKDWTRRGHRARLLLLTRHALNPDPAGHRRLSAVETALRRGLSPEHAETLLRARLEGTRFAQADTATLRRVAGKLQRVPIALVQFAGYLRTNQSAITLTDRFIDTNSLLRLFDPEQMEDSIERIYSTHIRLLSKDARRLLGLVAWAAEPVPFSGLLAVAGKNGGKLLTTLLLSGQLEEVEGPIAEGRPIGMHPLLRELTAAVEPDEAAARGWRSAGLKEYNLGRMRPARALFALAEIVLRKLVEEGRAEFGNDLASAIINKGVALTNLGQLDAAVAAYDQGIAILRRLVEREGRAELANDLAAAIMNKGNALQNLGRLGAAVAAYDQAIAILRRLVKRAGRAEFVNDLASAIMNKGVALYSLGRLDAEAFDEAIAIRRRLVEQEGHAEFANDLANAIVNKGALLDSLGRSDAAVEAFDQAIAILRQLVDQEGRGELANDLAAAIMNQGNALLSLGRLDAAVQAFDQAIAILRHLVDQEGRAELANDLADTIINKGNALQNLERSDAAVEAYDQAVAIFRRLVEQEGRAELAKNLASAIMNKGAALKNLGQLDAAMEFYDEAIAIRRRLVEQEGRAELANDLATALYNLALVREQRKEFPLASQAARESRRIWEQMVNNGWGHLRGDLEDARRLEARLSAQES